MENISSQYGKIELKLKTRGNYQKPPVNTPIKFDSSDQNTTENLFRNHGKTLDFSLIVENPIVSIFYIYLGENIFNNWDEDYVIKLESELTHSDETYYRANEKDAQKILTNFWCAGSVKITLCDGEKSPVLTREGNYLQTVIGLDYDPWYRLVYDGIRDDLNLNYFNQRIDITTPFKELAHIAEIARQNGNNSEITALYYRIKNLIPELKKIITAIIKNPASKAIRTIKSHYLENNLAVEQYFINIQSQDFLAVHTVQKVGNQIYPNSFVTSDIKISQDLPENQIVAICIKQIIEHIQTIKNELIKYINDVENNAKKIYNKSIHYNNLQNDIQKHKQVQLEIEKSLNCFKNYQRYFPIVNHQYFSNYLNLASELLYYDNRYATIWKILNKINKYLKYVDTSEKAIPFQVAPFCEVYERWCLFKIVGALQELGFAEIEQGKNTPFYHNPRFNSLFRLLQHPNHSAITLQVFYEKKYKKIDDNSDDNSVGWYYNSSRSFEPLNKKHTPDIALEFNGFNHYPIIITFDATLGSSSQICSEKYVYKKTIRVKQGTDFKHIVKAAWAIAPGQQFQNDLPHYIDQDENFSEGTIILNHDPESQKSLKNTLKKIIDHHISSISDN